MQRAEQEEAGSGQQLGEHGGRAGDRGGGQMSTARVGEWRLQEWQAVKQAKTVVFGCTFLRLSQKVCNTAVCSL